MRKAQAGLGRLALRRKDTADGGARVPQRAGGESGRSGHGAHGSGRGTARRGQRQEAKTETLNALEIAPSFDRALDLLLKINESGG